MAHTSSNNNNNNNNNLNEIKSYKEDGLPLNSNFITGYVEGDGSFSIRLRKSSSSTFGYNANIVFSIGAEVNSLNLKFLERVKDYFGVGSISKSGNMYFYEISAPKALIKVRKHFEDYPLQSSKYVHFKLWCQVMDIVATKEHLTKRGFYKVLSIKSVFPKGLSEAVLEAYPYRVPIVKPEHIPSKTLLNPYWIAGFTQADGSFSLRYAKAASCKLGYNCSPIFRITQHERDLVLLERIIDTLGCGKLIRPSSGRDRYDISVWKPEDISNTIIPFFKKYSIYGAKSLDFQFFCQGVAIIEKKGHLTPDGLDQLKLLAYSMNTYRKL
jgi:hypothetical protein